MLTNSAYIQGDIGEAITASELRSKCGMLVLRNLSDDYVYKLYDFLKSYSDQSLNARLDFLEVLRGDL